MCIYKRIPQLNTDSLKQYMKDSVFLSIYGHESQIAWASDVKQAASHHQVIKVPHPLRRGA